MSAMIRQATALLLMLPLGLLSGETQAADDSAVFDAELAAELGADEYGMRRYTLVNLESGSVERSDADEQARLQSAHLAHIRALADSGQLVLAGPYLDEASPRGIFILAVEDMEQARSLVEADPAVQAGLLNVSLRPWYGSAALMELNDIHERISREQP